MSPSGEMNAGGGATSRPTGPAPPLVDVRAVTRRFGDFVAVDAADLTVEPGEVVGLLGANGAGKTTLIRLILGLLRPSGGRVRLFGEPPSRRTRRRLGYVPQGLGLWEDLTVTENLEFSAGAFGVVTRSDRAVAPTAGATVASAPATAAPTRASHAAEPLDADLRAARDQLVRDLPLGLRRRLAFAAALAHHPDLLLLDEPTSGVDPLARAHLWDTIHATVEGGAGALVTTHYMDEAEQCDRLVVMAQGVVIAQGTMRTIIGAATAVEVEADHWESAFAALDAADLPLALAGRLLRVPGGDEARVQAALDARLVAARIRIVPATFEETFVTLATTRQENP
jgi:ABC-2 type transport system ATP-binding protein